MNILTLKKLLIDCTKDINSPTICRICYHISEAYSCPSGVQTKLKELDQKEDAIICLCEEVGCDDVAPLISLIDLLRVENGLESLTRCKTILERHQEQVCPPSECIQCTSPPTSPVRMRFNNGAFQVF